MNRDRALLVAVSFAWGATFTVNLLALKVLSPVAILVLRFGLAALVMFPFVFRSRLVLKEVAWSAVTGGLLFGGYLLQLEGQRFMTASTAGFLTGLSVVLVPVFLLFYRRRPSLLEITAVVTATVGLALVSRPTGREDLAGIADLLGCAALFGLEIVVMSRHMRDFRPINVVFYQVFTVLVLGLLFGGFFGDLEPIHLDATAGLAIAFNAVIATAGAFFVQARALKKLSSVEVAIIYSLEPVFALLVAMRVSGTGLSMLGLVGGILMVIAMILVSLDKGDLDNEGTRAVEIDCNTGEL